MTSLDRGSPRVRRLVLSILALVLVAGSGVALLRPAFAKRLVTSGVGRWREMHTPDGGRERVLAPEVVRIVEAMKTSGWRHYRFSDRMENKVETSPFIVEASWPITCRLSDENVVGFGDELRAIPSCQLIHAVGEYALAHCRP